MQTRPCPHLLKNPFPTASRCKCHTQESHLQYLAVQKLCLTDMQVPVGSFSSNPHHSLLKGLLGHSLVMDMLLAPKHLSHQAADIWCMKLMGGDPSVINLLKGFTFPRVCTIHQMFLTQVLRQTLRTTSWFRILATHNLSRTITMVS